MANQNLALQLVISARDAASGVLGALTGRVAQLGAAITAYFSGQAIVEFFASGTASANTFEKAMKELAYAAKAPPAELALLRAEAERIAQSDLPYSAQEAAAGMTALAKAGQDTFQILAALPDVLALAQGGALEVAAAAELTTRSLSMFGLQAADSAQVSNTLVAAADATETSVSALGEALTQAGPQAAAAGYSIQQTTAALALMARGGLEGGAAGTALKSVLAQLEDPTNKASGALSAMGVTSRDLNTVLAALGQGGPMAKAAILAFGLEAGPGLQTLIKQGSAGVAGLTADLHANQTAAIDAAAALTTDWDRAWKGLAATWDTIKRRLSEGLLAPVTKELHALSADLSAWLNSGELEQLRTGLVATFEAGADSVKVFIATLDLPALMTRISEFAANSKDTFAAWQANVATVGDATGRILAAMSGGWNGFRAIIETIGVAITGLVSGVTWALAQAESAAAKIGLGSTEQAAKLMAAHQAMEETARAYATAAKTHYRAAGDAFEQMVDRQTTAAAGVTTAAAAQTQALSLTADQLDALGDAATFAGAGQAALTTGTAALTTATAAQAAAVATQTGATTTQTAAVQAQTFEVDGAAVAVQEWNAKTGQWVTTTGQAATASLSAAEAAKQQAARAVEAAAQLALLIKQQEAEIETLGRATALATQECQVRATRLTHLQAEATARGDTAEAERLAQAITRTTIDLGRAEVTGKEAEAAAARALATSLREQAEANRDASTETMKGVTAAEQAAAAKKLDAAASVELLRHHIALASAAEDLARQERLLGDAFAAAGVAGVKSIADVLSAVRGANTSGELEALGQALKAAFREGVLGADEYKKALDEVKAKQDALKGAVRQASTDFADIYAQVGSDLGRFRALSPGLSADALAALTDQYRQWLAANHPEPSARWDGGAAPTTPPPATGGSSWGSGSTAPQVTVRLELPGNRQVNGQFSAADADLLKSMGQSFAST